MLAEQWRAASDGRCRSQPHQRSRIAETARNRMIDLDERAALFEMRMLGRLGDGQHGANRQSDFLPLAHQPIHIVLEKLLLDQRTNDIVILGALRGIPEQNRLPGRQDGQAVP